MGLRSAGPCSHGGEVLTGAERGADRALDEDWTSGAEPRARCKLRGWIPETPRHSGQSSFPLWKGEKTTRRYPLTRSGASPVVCRIRPSVTMDSGSWQAGSVLRDGDALILLGIPLGWPLESPSPGSLETQKETLPPLQPVGGTVPPAQGPCVRSNSTEGGSPGEGKGLERSHCIPVQGPDFPGKGTGRSKFSLSQSGAQSQPKAGE